MVAVTLCKLSWNTIDRSTKVCRITNSESNDRSLLEFVRSVFNPVNQYNLHEDFSQLNAPQYWKTKILVDSSKRFTGKNHFPIICENNVVQYLLAKAVQEHTVKNVR